MAKGLGKFVGHQQPSACDAEQLRIGVVIVLVSFDVEKGEPVVAIAHRKIKRIIRRKFFHNEVVDGCT
ncbi:MAG: hypothetical protein DMF11_03995 [Verrucomicrobia bacterium]|nr:MAG: hypothetical protein DMF11_03995 [Verrucomicrobiota bacterium]